MSTARCIPLERVGKLVVCLQRVMSSAINSGGSTIRDYIDGNGSTGQFAQTLKAYGRAGLPCGKCGRRLSKRLVAQRTSVYCAHCQVRHSR
jgi:formamidopyrimidine-DNA glycosylase